MDLAVPEQRKSKAAYLDEAGKGKQTVTPEGVGRSGEDSAVEGVNKAAEKTADIRKENLSKEGVSMFHPVVKLKVYNEELVYGPGLITLLEFLRTTGSMKEACKKMGMSYSKGWKLVNRAEKELGYDLLLRRHGGSMGGKCEITEDGDFLIIRYRQMEQKVNELTQAAFGEYFPEYADAGRHRMNTN